MTWSTITWYLCHKCQRICSTCRNHNPVLFSYMTYHQVSNKSITTGVTCGAGTVTPGAHEVTPGLSGVRIARSLVFCAIFCRLVPVLLLAIALSVLRLTASDYPFGITKLSSSGTHKVNRFKLYLYIFLIFLVLVLNGFLPNCVHTFFYFQRENAFQSHNLSFLYQLTLLMILTISISD